MSEVTKLALAIIAGATFVLVVAFGAAVNNRRSAYEYRQWEYDKEHCVEWSREEALPRKCNCYDNEKCANAPKENGK